MEHHSFDIVLKVSERCNLACPYCYYYFQEFNSESKSRLITKEVVDELPNFLFRSARSLNLDRINIVLHGGEPLLLGVKRTDLLCSKILDKLRDTVEVTFAVQTNGVLIDENWIDFFKKFDVKVGVSLDGLPEVHDKMRPDHKGRGSFDRCIQGYKLAEKHFTDSNRGHCGALGVVHNSENEDEMLSYMIEDLGVLSPNLNFPRGGWDFPDAIEFGASVENHRKLMSYYLKNHVYPDFKFVRGLSDVLFALMSESGAERNDLRSSCRHHISTISSEGDLYVDDNLLGLSDEFGEDQLNIFGNSSLSDLLDGDLWQELNDAIDYIPSECEECEWQRTCRSGELFNRFSKKDRFRNKSVLCDTIKMLHEEAASFLVGNGVCTLEDLSERLSKKAVHTAESTYLSISNLETDKKKIA